MATAHRITCACCPTDEPIHADSGTACASGSRSCDADNSAPPSQEEDHSGEIRLLVTCALLFFGILIFEDRIAAALQSLAPGLALGEWGVRALYLVPYLLCGGSIFRAAFTNIRAKAYLNEFTLMCGATIAAIALGEMPEAVGVMLFYRIGEFFQERAAAGSRRSIKSLLASKPSVAHVEEDGILADRAVEDVQVGQRMQVRAGEKIPLDGEVTAGESLVDQSPLTGEPVPVTVRPGSTVLGGSINLSGVLTVIARSRFADTHMARILEMVEHAAMRKSPTERFITRFARYYTPAVVALAFLVAVLPPLFMEGATFQTWVYRALVLLVISCPCALIISIPLGYFGGIGAASRKGILVKGGNVLDGLLHVDTVVFDKTGTLTRGVFDVTALTPAPGVTEQDLLLAALTAEQHSNHPIARSLLAYAHREGVTLPPQNTEAAAREIPGKGMAATVSGTRYLAGTAALLGDHGITVPPQEHAGALVYVAKDNAYLGCILVADVIRPDAAEGIASLSHYGLKTFMLTGDRESSAAWVAKQTGLNGYKAGLMPEGKVEAIHTLGGSERAAFVGDGINDAPILAVSRVGIAMGGIGSEAAIEASDAVILNDSPSNVATLFRIAKDVRNVVWQNIALALGIKISFMALGIVGLSGLWEAVFADVGVALLAVLNSTRIMRGK